MIGQCLALTTKTDLPPRQYGEAVAVLVLVALLLIALPAAAPRAFERVRLLVAGGVRLLLFAQPVVRHPRGLLTVFQVRRRGAGQPLRGAWLLLQVTSPPCHRHAPAGAPAGAPACAQLTRRCLPVHCRVPHTQGAPSHRAAGLLLDLWRLLLGSRAVAMVVTPLACPLPMLPNLALLAYALHVRAGRLALLARRSSPAWADA